jgi:hypothetical protein
MTWWTDYNLTYSEAPNQACKLDVGAWVTLVNQSGASYNDAKLKLIAGDVQRAEPPQRYPAAAPAQALRMEMKAADGFAEKAFFEYHLYTLGRPTSLPDNSTKQIELSRRPRRGLREDLVYYGLGSRYPGLRQPDDGPQLRRAVEQEGRRVPALPQREGQRPGRAAAAGRLRVSKLDTADNSLEFIGEDLIDHTARDEMVQVKLGSAFDVVGERKQLDFRIDTTAKWIEEDIEVRVRNQKPDESASVVVKENLYRWSTWNVIRKEPRVLQGRRAHHPLRRSASRPRRRRSYATRSGIRGDQAFLITAHASRGPALPAGCDL